MENKKKNTDFIDFGTYKAEEAEILKRELEKHGISVKVLYPGTDLGRGITAEAYFTAYTLMIQACDIPTAEKIREKFNIKSVGIREKMPLPKTYAWGKRGLSRVALIGYLVSFFGMLVTGYLSDKLQFLPEDTSSYFITAFFLFFLLWFCSTVYNILEEKKKH